MKLLALDGGSPGGNTELLLKEALMAAEEAGLEVEMLRLVDLALPAGRPGTLPPDVPDDRPFVVEKLIACDALIIGAPVYNRGAPGLLKLLIDRAVGPRVDVAAMLRAKEGKNKGDPRFEHNIVDERLLKPRVAGFISVAGATSADWATFGLPMMHMATFSMQIAVVDQLQVMGVAMPGAVLFEPDMLARARKLGANVASQVGRAFDDAEYLSDVPGLCPTCHLDMIVVKAAGAVECAVCASQGRIEIEGGVPVFVFPPEGRRLSIFSIEGKHHHQDEMDDVTARHMPRAPSIPAMRLRHDAYNRPLTPPSKAGDEPRAAAETMVRERPAAVL